jgi:hypothetical protein
MSRTVAVLVVFVAATACGSVASRGPASSARTSSTVSSPSNPPPANTGQIAGALSYPAGVLPAQTVYAIATDGSRFFTVETVFGQRTYTMLGVAPGDYFVLTIAPGFLPYDQVIPSLRPSPVHEPFPAGYTKAVPCGGSTACSDHTLISVHVMAGTTTSGVDPADWCWPQCSLPIIPPSGTPPVRSDVPNYSPSEPLPAFQDRNQAAAQIASAETAGRFVASPAACPMNVACVWNTGERDGQSAAYLTVSARSNGISQNCVVYLVNRSSGWSGLGGGVFSSVVCSQTGTPFPIVGGSGQIQMALGETGCVNVHSNPSLGAKVMACLSKGTTVIVDDGPAYVPATPPLPQIDLPWALDYWWHLAGQGWVVHAYLLTRHYG